MGKVHHEELRPYYLDSTERSYIKWLYADGVTRATLARTFGVPKRQIDAIVDDTLCRL